MRGKKLTRCEDCGVDSDKKIILVYRGSQKCQNCAAMQAMESRTAMKDVQVTYRRLAKEEGAREIGPSPNILADTNDES